MSTDAYPTPPEGYDDLYRDEDDELTAKAKAKGKLPYIKLFHGDILGDMDLMGCPDAAQFLWWKMMLTMAKAEPYGHLATHGVAMTTRHLARTMKWGIGKTERALAALESVRIFSRRADGMIYSRRMVRDRLAQDLKDAANKENGKRGIEGASGGHLGGRGNKKSNPLRAVGGTEIQAPKTATGNPPGGFVQTPHSDSDSDSNTSGVVPDHTTFDEKNSGTGIPNAMPPEAIEARAIEVCAMLAGHGITETHPGNARLRNLIAQGAMPSEFEAIADRKGAKDSGQERKLGYVLKAVRQEREKAAKDVLPPRVETPPTAAAKTPQGGFPSGVIRPAEPYHGAPITAPAGGPPPPVVRGALAKLRATFPPPTPSKEVAQALAAAAENAHN
jgi:hypothetical protein